MTIGYQRKVQMGFIPNRPNQFKLLPLSKAIKKPNPGTFKQPQPQPQEHAVLGVKCSGLSTPRARTGTANQNLYVYMGLYPRSSEQASPCVKNDHQIKSSPCSAKPTPTLKLKLNHLKQLRKPATPPIRQTVATKAQQQSRSSSKSISKSKKVCAL